MSWATQFARSIGLGPVLDAIEAAEANPTPASIAGAVGGIVAALPEAGKVANVAITDLGGLAQTAISNVADKIKPGAGSVAAGIVGPFLSEIEAVAEKFLASETAGLL